MPINNITQTISTLPPAGSRGVDVQTQFVIKQEDFQDHLQGITVTELNTLKDQLNSRIGEINSTTTTMNGYASTASAGASTATTKAGEASISAGEALAYKNQAESFKNNASTSATKASQWADNNYNVEVETGKYSAKHWSTVAQNATANKIDKVTSTDNAVVRFNGITGEVQNSAITIDDVGNIGSGTQTFNGFGGSGFKNYIINGNFDIWQRGTIQTTSGYDSDDRWNNNSLGSTKTHSKVACTNTEIALFNASNFSRTVVTSVAGTSNSVTKRQGIEDVTKLAGKTVTVSFWAKADTTKNIWVEFKQLFGTGGSPSTTVVGLCGQAIPLTSTWQKKTITITLPSIIGKTLGTDGVHTTATELQFWFDVGSGNIVRIPTGIQQSGTFDIAQVQLEEGSVATPFENRPYGLELSLCQRYYEVGRCIQQLGIGTTIGVALTGQVFFKTSKRLVPTVTCLDFSGAQNKVTLLNNSGTETNGVSIIAGNQTNNDMRLTASTTNTTQNGIGFTYIASAEL